MDSRGRRSCEAEADDEEEGVHAKASAARVNVPGSFWKDAAECSVSDDEAMDGETD